MKIALISEWLDPWRGGAETSTLQFMHHLREKGIEVHVFTRSRPAAAPGLHVHTISGAAMTRTRQSMTFALRAERRIKAEPFDVVHAISPCRCADIYQPRGGTVAESIQRNLALLGNRSARRLKRWGNLLNFKQRYMLGLEREIMREGGTPVIVAISDYVARQLKTHYGLSDRRIRKIRNAVDPDDSSESTRQANREAIRREFGIGPGDCLVLLVAHNFRLKGVARWMEALARLVKEGTGDVRSLIVGKGDSPAWQRRAGRLGITDFLTLTGPSQRVRAFFHAADVLVHPTYYDPCSRVVLEAMSMGLPCVTTRWDGASEQIVNGENGFVLEEPDETATLADCIGRLRDAALRETFSRNCAALRDSLCMERHASEMLTLYDEIASSNVARA